MSDPTLRIDVKVDQAPEAASAIRDVADAARGVQAAADAARPATEGQAEALRDTADAADAAAQAMTGAADAAAAVEGATKPAKDEATSAGKAFAEAGNAGVILGQILRGNFAALKDVTRAWQSLKVAIASNPWGLIASGAALVATALLPLLTRLGTAKKANEDLADATAATTEQLRDQARLLDQARLDGLASSLDAIARKADEAVSRMKALQSAADLLDDAQLAADLAELEALPIREEEKVRRSFALRRASRDRKNQRQLIALQRDEDALATAAADQGSAAAAAAREAAAARAEADAKLNDELARERRLATLEASLPAARAAAMASRSQVVGVAGAGVALRTPEQERLAALLEEIDRTRDSIVEQQGPERQEARRRLEERADQLEAAAAAATRRAEEAERQLNQFREQADLTRLTIPLLQRQEDRLMATQERSQTESAREADQAVQRADIDAEIQARARTIADEIIAGSALAGAQPQRFPGVSTGGLAELSNAARDLRDGTDPEELNVVMEQITGYLREYNGRNRAVDATLRRFASEIASLREQMAANRE